MISKSIQICFLAIVLILNESIVAKDFCLGFIENDNKISYVYKRIYGDQLNGKQEIFHIIINGFSWRLTFSGQTREDLSIDTKGIESPFFSTKFVKSQVACLRTSSSQLWKNGRAVIFDHYSNTALIGDIANDTFKEEEVLSKYKMSESTQRHMYYDIDFIFDDSFSEDCKGCYQLVIINKRDWSHKQVDNYEPHRYFLFLSKKTSALVFSPDYYREKYLKRFEAIRQLNTTFQLIGIVVQYSKIYSNNYGFVLLFKDNFEIKWCWTHANTLSDECRNPSLLIDCNEPESTPQTSNLTTILIIVLIFVFITVSIIGVILYLRESNKEKRDKRGSTRDSTISSIKPKKSLSPRSKLSLSKSPSKAVSSSPKTPTKVVSSVSTTPTKTATNPVPQKK